MKSNEKSSYYNKGRTDGIVKSIKFDDYSPSEEVIYHKRLILDQLKLKANFDDFELNAEEDTVKQRKFSNASKDSQNIVNPLNSPIKLPNERKKSNMSNVSRMSSIISEIEDENNMHNKSSINNYVLNYYNSINPKAKSPIKEFKRLNASKIRNSIELMKDLKFKTSELKNRKSSDNRNTIKSSIILSPIKEKIPNKTARKSSYFNSPNSKVSSRKVSYDMFSDLQILKTNVKYKLDSDNKILDTYSQIEKVEKNKITNKDILEIKEENEIEIPQNEDFILDTILNDQRTMCTYFFDTLKVEHNILNLQIFHKIS